MLAKIPLINPYFEVGMLHNKALDYIASQLHAPAVPEAPQLVALVTEWYVLENGNTSPENKSVVYALTARGMNNAQKMSPAELCAAANLSSAATEFVIQTLALAGDFSVILPQLYEINNRALAADLSEQDQFYTLLTLAVAIKSAEYGQLQEQLADKSPWIGYGSRPWSWSQDAQGAISGALGGMVGGLFGPPGALVAGILGGLAGAIGQSLGDWLFGGG